MDLSQTSGQICHGQLLHALSALPGVKKHKNDGNSHISKKGSQYAHRVKLIV